MMQQTIEQTGVSTNESDERSFVFRPLRRGDVIAGLATAAGYAILALACLALSKFDASLASIWVPNAAAVALLLRARLSSEIPVFIGVFAASTLANHAFGSTLATSLVFSLANVAGIGLIVWLTRKMCGQRPDMTDLADLARFGLAGGIAGPVLSAAIASSAMGPDRTAAWDGGLAWLLTDSMGMVLVVPTVLLSIDAITHRVTLSAAELTERVALFAGGMGAAFLVFRQDIYPLLFLVPPITLLHAFRLGSLGSALYVVGIASVTSAMTWAGFGPIARVETDPSTELMLIQVFVAANLLTGLPVAAILTGRARIAEELKKGERALALLADNITDAVLRVRADGRCSYASPSVVDVLSRDPSEFIGKRVSENIHPDAAERIAGAEEEMLSGRTAKQRFTYRRLRDCEDGNPVFIEADCAGIANEETGDRDGYVVSLRDVTQRVELELQLNRARHHAENAARAKSEFLANMSHEIRTPMNGILGFAELMQQTDLDPDQKRQMAMIVQSGRSMMLLLNDILDLSKIEAGQIVIDHAPVDLDATLAECAALHRANAEQKGLELRFEREDMAHEDHSTKDVGDPGNWVVTDGLRVRQIVLNLIGNAVKFTESGLVRVSYSIGEDTFRVRVMDTGIGINPSRLDSVFHPFTQAEGDTSRRFGGTGLGLTISRQLAELLGGFIDLESEAGIGSCFTLTLPATRAEPEARPQVQTQPLCLEDLPEEARILLVEDHDVNRILATEMLERCGQRVAVAHDGNEAISMVIDSVMRGTPFDLVLMDIQMPGCDGYAATRAIRAEGIGPDDLPIVALTANAFPEDVAAARDAGMQGHLAKPMVFADLARVLQRWLPTRIVDDLTDASRADSTSAVVRIEDARPPAEPLDAGKDPQNAIPQVRSPELVQRWAARRDEAVEAVRQAACTGALGSGRTGLEDRDALARIVHKLAGTAAMFGEPELGEQASAFEKALRNDAACEVQQTLAFELIAIADRMDGSGSAVSNG